MTVLISHTTALWILCSPRLRAPLGACRGAVGLGTRRELADRLPEIAKALGWDVAGTGAIDILVRPGSNRRRTRLAYPHAWSRALPEGALLSLCDGVAVASPELAYLQMAEYLDVIELAQLASSLCGGYFPSADARGFVDRQPLTSIERIGDFLAKLRGTRNVTKARRALACAHDLARSPMETTTAMLLSMSRRRGGYGLPRPQLNHRVELPKDVAAAAGTGHFLVDLFYRRAGKPGGVAIEYLGRAYHKDVARDITRELLLKRAGCPVVDVTITQIVRSELRNQLVGDIAHEIGYRLRKGTQRIRERRNDLLNRILPHPSQIAPDGSVTWEKPSWALPAELAGQVG
ncbi:MAG: hypothetical protein ACI38Z_01270 [Parafannyhessea sp.]|uniref:hypothetical protein n=1 Tax=Parafannyhessea sp. TaxID=2847324 RepID=UPI003F07484D